MEHTKLRQVPTVKMFELSNISHPGIPGCLTVSLLSQKQRPKERGYLNSSVAKTDACGSRLLIW